jgi:hypothetical protein
MVPIFSPQNTEKGIPQIADQKFVKEPKQVPSGEKMMDMSRFSKDDKRSVGMSINEKIAKVFDIDLSIIAPDEGPPGGFNRILDDSILG